MSIFLNLISVAVALLVPWTESNIISKQVASFHVWYRLYLLCRSFQSEKSITLLLHGRKLTWASVFLTFPHSVVTVRENVPKLGLSRY